MSKFNDNMKTQLVDLADMNAKVLDQHNKNVLDKNRL